VNNLPSLKVNVIAKVDGSNLPIVTEAVTKFVEGINTDLNLDADFVQAKEDVKTLKGLEDGLKDAKATLLAQTEELNRLLIAVDELVEVARKKRLWLKPEIVTREEEVIKLIIQGFVTQAVSFTAEKTNGRGYVFDLPMFDPWAAVKGAKRTTENYAKKLSVALDEYKENINSIQRGLDAKTLIFEQHAEGYKHLFPDAARIIQGTDASMIKDIVNARIVAARQADEERAAAVEAPKGVELPRFETVETVDVETGEVAEVKREIEMVSLPKLRLLEVLETAACTLLDRVGTGSKALRDLDKLISHIKGQ